MNNGDMMKYGAFTTIKEWRQLLTKKEISSRELLALYKKRFEQYDKELNTALEIFDEESIVERSAISGSLAGIPGLIKDIISQKDRELTCGSKILKGFRSTFDATAVSRLKEAGALLMGRANCDEFAMGSSNEYSAFGPVHNPWDLSRVSGGSSGGSVAAVAAGLVPWALGTETGGSVRQPAAFCGVVGLKPTYGAISRYGVVAYASSFDQIGVATRTVYDNALVFSQVAGHDPKDATSLSRKKIDFTINLDGKITKGIRIGIVENALYKEGVDAEIVAAIETAIKQIESLGATIKKVTLPVLDYVMAAYVILSRAEAASNLAKFDGVRYGARDKKAETLMELYNRTRRAGFGEQVRRRILVGNYVLSAGHAAAFYHNAKKVQGMVKKGFSALFDEVDLLLMPVSPTPAFAIGGITNPLHMDLQDYFTCPINVAGVPAISVPCGFTNDILPIGMQFVGPQQSEELLFKTAYAYEQASAWHTMHPKSYL